MSSPKHSNLGPSSAKRWISCPGSVQACADAPPQPASIHAAEGSVAHDLAERLVTGRITDHGLMGRVGDIVEFDGFDIAITEEMVNGAILYRDFIVAETKALARTRGDIPVVGKAEVRVKAASIDAGLFGTADYLLYKKGKKLLVVDYKFGKGVAVSPEENEQLGIYALGALEGEAKGAYDEVELVIVQPRAGGEAVKRWVANREAWLAEFREAVCAAVEATKAPNAPRAAGDWCRWCAAKPECKAAYEYAQNGAMVAFKDAPPAPLAKGVLPDISTLSIEQVTQALEHEDFINSWFEAIKLRIRGLLDRGEEVPGWKLVAGKTNRQWTDEAAVVKEFAPLLGETALYERKVLSPAKLEKLVGKGKVEHLTFKPEAKLAIARADDPRPEARRSVTEVFDAIPMVGAAKSKEDAALDELLGITSEKPESKKIWA